MPAGRKPKMMEPGEAMPGAQSLQRAAMILRAFSGAPEAGWHARDVAARVGLNLSTTDRMMRALAHERLLERFGPDRLYRIGPEIRILADLRGGHASVAEHYRPMMERIAARTSDTAFLWVRSGDEAVCVATVEGNFHIRVLPAAVGNRRALGLGAGALSLLAALPDAEIEGIVQRNAPAYAALDLTGDVIRQKVRRTREQGFAHNDGFTIPEMRAVGIVLPDPADRLLVSISVAAIDSRFPLQRQQEVLAMLREEVFSAAN